MTMPSHSWIILVPFRLLALMRVYIGFREATEGERSLEHDCEHGNRDIASHSEAGQALAFCRGGSAPSS
jgi:hypothetical protein